MKSSSAACGVMFNRVGRCEYLWEKNCSAKCCAECDKARCPDRCPQSKEAA